VSSSPLVCPDCRSPIDSALCCADCGSRFSREDDIADFSRGEYYDAFDPNEGLPARDEAGLALEVDGARRRIVDFYEPLLRQKKNVSRVLDSGCGNGVSVDLLREHGYDAWGNDLSALRKHQWRARQSRDRLVVASSLHLPFASGYFDAVISSGVIEHIGVVERAVPRYDVRPTPERDSERCAFVAELLRVLRAGGSLFLDFPNGAFPIDFWHGDHPGAARRHPRTEGFLPTFREIRALVRSIAPRAVITAISPFRRLQFHQARRHLHGRILSPFVNAAFRAMTVRPLRFLATTCVNPFLVVCITSGNA